jgi:hypothetical protein
MSSTHNGGSKGDTMLTWLKGTRSGTRTLTTSYERAAQLKTPSRPARNASRVKVILSYRGGGLWEGSAIEDVNGAWVGSWTVGVSDLRSMKDKIEAIASGQPSPWRKGKRYGYRYSGSGVLCNYVWSFECGAWIAAAWSSGAEGTPDERFTSAAAARAYCDKAIGGAA